MEVFVKCPETFRTYSIGVHAFAEILEKNGTPLEAARPQKRSPQQIEEIVKKFCNARDLSFMKSEHAQEVIDSGREITKIPLKGKKKRMEHTHVLYVLLFKDMVEVFKEKKTLNGTTNFISSTLALRATIVSTETLVQIT